MMVTSEAFLVFLGDKYGPGQSPLNLFLSVTGEIRKSAVDERDRHVILNDERSGPGMLEDAPVHIAGQLHLRFRLSPCTSLKNHVPEFSELC